MPAVTMVEAAATGDRVQSLQALRDVLADAIDRCESSRDMAALSRQFTLVVKELAEIEPVKGDVVDELAAERTARRRQAQGS